MLFQLRQSIMMCVNKDLLEKEGISIPESGWTLEDFYEICKKVTKDTNGDGVVDQYGITDYIGSRLW